MFDSRSRGLRVAGVFCVCAVAFSPPLSAIEPQNVLLLYNADSPDGLDIASHYQQIHPGVQVLELLGVSTDEEITATHYLDVIRPQVLSALTPSIDVIVTTKGMPLRIEVPYGNPDPNSIFSWERYSSLESELTRVDTISTSVEMGDQMWWWPGEPHHSANPYYDAGTAFDNQTYGMRLTSRLDGFTTADVIASIDRAQVAFVGTGIYSEFVLDDDPNAPAADVDHMPELVANVLNPRGLLNTYDETDLFVADAYHSVLGYVSHGRNGSAPPDYLADPLNGIQFDLANGAVFHSWESFNAYSFVEGGNRGGQGLVAEWIARGGTAGAGHVQEPLASPATITNEDLMFEMLLDGFTWAEAAWNATVQLSFVNTFVGDPLMQFRPLVPGDGNLNGIVDADDYTIWANYFGTGTKFTEGDYNGDYTVDLADYTVWANGFSGIAVPGDANSDGVVDSGDYTIWVNNFGLLIGDATMADGDFNKDGFVNSADYVVWANNFTGGSASSQSAAVASAQSVPEPGSLTLALLGLAMMLWLPLGRRFL